MSLLTETSEPIQSRSASIQDSGYRCCDCGYNLTGIRGPACPECGWTIDWARAADEEMLRPGTAAHHARGWRILDQTLLTVGMMLVMPWRFARRLRADERLGPPLAVAVLSFTCLGLPDIADWRDLPAAFSYVFGVAAVILCQSLAFATLYRRKTDRNPRWQARFRMWILVSLYSTCFVGTWRLTGNPPYVESLTETNFYWPLDDYSSTQQLGVTIIYYWWWAILGVVLWVRNRPRWLGMCGIPLVFLFSFVGGQVTVFFMNLFG